jgi:hypothetical protein
MRVCGTRTRGRGGVHYLVCVLAQARVPACDCVREYMHGCVHVHVPECVCACMRVRAHTCVHMLVCVRACACVRSRRCVHANRHTCVRARVHARGARKLKTALGPGKALPLLALRAGARIPRAGKPRRSRNPHTAPTLLCATTAGAAGECPTLACLPRIVELARIRLRVGSGVEAPSFERCRLLTNRAPLCCVHTPTRGHTPRQAPRPVKRRSGAGPDLRDGDSNDLLLQLLDRHAWDR